MEARAFDAGHILDNDHYRKYILTLDEDPDADYNGIIRTNAIRWLLR